MCHFDRTDEERAVERFLRTESDEDVDPDEVEFDDDYEEAEDVRIVTDGGDD